MTLYKKTIRTGGSGGSSGPQNPLYITSNTYFQENTSTGELDLVVENVLRQSWTTASGPPPTNTGSPIGLLLCLTYP